MTCTCDTEYHEPDICPYKAEIEEEIVYCNCCPECREQCEMDI